MDYLPVAIALAVIGLLFLIENGFASTENYKRKALVNLVFGLIITTIFLVAYILDKINNKQLFKEIVYLSFIIAPLLYTIIIFSIYFKKGARMYQKIGGFGKTKTYIDRKKYLYLVYKYFNDVYLDKDSHQGIIYKLKKEDFHDEIIYQIANEYSVGLKDDDFEKIGEYTVKSKKDEVYYCYLVNLTFPLESDQLIAFNKKDLLNIDLEEMDKQIIFRTLLQEKFNIEVEKKKEVE